MKKIVLATLLALSSARAGEVWVVAGGSKSVKVVDTGSESVTASIPLPQGSQVSPRGVSFSTVDGSAGAFAYVGQGAVIHVIDANAKSTVRSIDLGAALGLPVTIVDLEASPNREFTTQSGPVVRAFLFVAADAMRTGSSMPEPFWIVLDQRALLQSPPPVPLVAGSGFLNAATVQPADRGRAAGISVMGAPRGASHLRAWMTTRVLVPPEKMRAILLEKGASLDAPWVVGAVKERVLPTGRVAPQSFSVAVPQDREAQIFPGGATGSLLDIDHGGSCELAPANFGPVAVRGPGAGGYQIVAVDLDAEDLVRVNESTCAYRRTPLGSGPVDVTVSSLFEHGAAWVANRDSDDVSVVRLDGSTARVALGPPPDSSCVECPNSIETRSGPGRACTTSLRLSKTPTGETLTWDTVGCTGASYAVYCQCDPRVDANCSCACDRMAPGCFGSLPVEGQTGVELGTVGSNGPLTRQLLITTGQDPTPMPYGPEPIIQLGLSEDPTFDDIGSGGNTTTGTRPP